jgi:hypothetical protein
MVLMKRVMLLLYRHHHHGLPVIICLLLHVSPLSIYDAQLNGCATHHAILYRVGIGHSIEISTREDDAPMTALPLWMRPLQSKIEGVKSKFVLSRRLLVRSSSSSLCLCHSCGCRMSQFEYGMCGNDTCCRSQIGRSTGCYKCTITHLMHPILLFKIHCPM